MSKQRETIERIAIFAITQAGVERAHELRGRLRTGSVHRPEKHGPASRPWDEPFTDLSERVRQQFHECDQLVFFLATGAVTRLVAPLLESKESDPGVIVVDDSGRYVIPLLGGHEAGANRFAYHVAGAIGAIPAVTTASENVSGCHFAQLAEAHNWTPEPGENYKPVALALANGEPVTVVQEVGASGAWLEQKTLPDHVRVVREAGGVTDPPAALIYITDRATRDQPPFSTTSILYYRPPSLVLGVGCERGVPSEALADGLERFLDAQGYAKASIAAVASADVKADEDAILELADAFECPLRLYSAAELAKYRDRIRNPSDVVEQYAGAPGVAEPAAMRAGETVELLVEKHIVQSPLSDKRMTFALARHARYVSAAPEQGHVTFIGAGPGDPELLTCKARRTLAQADMVVYAGSLIPAEVLRAAPPAVPLHNSAHLTLEEVSLLLIDAAQRGERVVRLQSGCLTLYSAIQEQMTLLDEAGVTYDVIPGISSFQAAAAWLGSQLTIPEKVQTLICTRTEGKTKMPEGESLESLARHGCTLAIFLSAPHSRNVQDELLTAYPSDTPVSIHYRVSWPDEENVVTELARLHDTVRQRGYTRTTLIMVGDAVTRRGARSVLYDATHAHMFRT